MSFVERDKKVSVTIGSCGGRRCHCVTTRHNPPQPGAGVRVVLGSKIVNPYPNPGPTPDPTPRVGPTHDNPYVFPTTGVISSPSTRSSCLVSHPLALAGMFM